MNPKDAAWKRFLLALPLSEQGWMDAESRKPSSFAFYVRQGVEFACGQRYKPASEIVDEWSFQL